jgi:hypothetical protein
MPLVVLGDTDTGGDDFRFSLDKGRMPAYSRPALAITDALAGASIANVMSH